MPTDRELLGTIQAMITSQLTPPPPLRITDVPLAYDAIMDRVARPKPPLPTLGPAGSSYVDPVFGNRIVRVTDTSTWRGKSCRAPSNSDAQAWASDSKHFYVTTEDGNGLVYAWDGLTATKIATYPPGGFQDYPGVTPPSSVEPSFSRDAASSLYVVSPRRQVQVYDSGTGQLALMLDLDAKYPTLNLAAGSDGGTYVGGLSVRDSVRWVAFFGGAQQDLHRYVHHSSGKFLDTLTRAGWHIHGCLLDRTGRYVMLGPTNADMQASGGTLSQVWMWDTQADTLVPVPNNSGHPCMGYAQFINQACLKSGDAYDAAQWQIRDLATPNVTRDVITNQLTPKKVNWADHSTWTNDRPGVVVPFISSTYRVPTDDTPWRALDDEIVAILPDGSDQFWRLAHHRSAWTGQFWDQPIANVSPNGLYVLFTSNMEGTLGTGRQDAFVLTAKGK